MLHPVTQNAVNASNANVALVVRRGTQIERIEAHYSSQVLRDPDWEA
jgi:hypothetical protein